MSFNRSFRPFPSTIISWSFITLLENNIYVNIETGHLARIVDWRDVEVSPLPRKSGGLETS